MVWIRIALAWSLETKKFEECARLSAYLGLFWLDRNYFSEGCHWLERPLENRELLSKGTIAYSLRILSRLLARIGDYDRAIQCGKESIAIFGEMGAKFELALAIQFLGTVMDENGDEMGMTYYMQALQLYRELGYKGYENEILIEVGWANVNAGNLSEGFTILEESLKSLRERFEIQVLQDNNLNMR